MSWVGDAPFVDLIRLDTASDVRRECLDWIDTVWLPLLMANRSAKSAARYRCINGEPQELILLGSEHQQGDEPIATLPLGDPMIERWTRNYETATFQQIYSQGASASDNEFINAITTRVRASAAPRFSDWYSTVHMPEILECPGWECGRRYERTDRDSEFLALYQVTDPETPFHSPQYESAVGWDGFDQVMLGFHGFRIYAVEQSFSLASGVNSPD